LRFPQDPKTPANSANTPAIIRNSALLGAGVLGAPRFTGGRDRVDLEHFPPKWTPVRRRKCDQIKESRAGSDST
jgi:hypothetical protein